MAEYDLVVLRIPYPVGIRTTVSHARHHCVDGVAVDSALRGDARYAAHFKSP
jgi:hypothetical protein